MTIGAGAASHANFHENVIELFEFLFLHTCSENR